MYRVGASIVREDRSIAEGVHPETIFVNRAPLGQGGLSKHVVALREI